MVVWAAVPSSQDQPRPCRNLLLLCATSSSSSSSTRHTRIPSLRSIGGRPLRLPIPTPIVISVRLRWGWRAYPGCHSAFPLLPFFALNWRAPEGFYLSLVGGSSVWGAVVLLLLLWVFLWRNRGLWFGRLVPCNACLFQFNLSAEAMLCSRTPRTTLQTFL